MDNNHPPTTFEDASTSFCSTAKPIIVPLQTFQPVAVTTSSEISTEVTPCQQIGFIQSATKTTQTTMTSCNPTSNFAKRISCIYYVAEYCDDWNHPPDLTACKETFCICCKNSRTFLRRLHLMITYIVSFHFFTSPYLRLLTILSFSSYSQPFASFMLDVWLTFLGNFSAPN